MKSITIHNLDDELYLKIKESAKENHRSLNQEVKEKLAKYFVDETKYNKKESLKKYFGVWSQQDYQEFQKNTADNRVIDPSDWE